MPLVESVFEYGSRRGIWRLLDLFEEFSVRASILAVGRAVEQNLPMTKAFVDRGHEIVGHGYRWIDYCLVPEEVERDHIRRTVEILTRVAGTRPIGWMTGRPGQTLADFWLKPVAFSTTAIRSPMNFPTGSK